MYRRSTITVNSYCTPPTKKNKDMPSLTYPYYIMYKPNCYYLLPPYNHIRSV